MTPALSIGKFIIMHRGKEVPLWLDTMGATITRIGRKRYRVSVPVDDDKERWISASQITLN